VRLIPRDEQFFPLFDGLSARLSTAAQLLAQLFAEPDRLQELVQKIKDVEHEADGLTHDLIVRIDKSFVTPFDREDIHLLASRLDDVIDLIDGVARRAQMFQIREFRPQAAQLADVLRRGAETIASSVAGLKKPQPDPAALGRAEEAGGGGRRHLPRRHRRPVRRQAGPHRGHQVEGAVRQAGGRRGPLRRRVERPREHRPQELVTLP
jgi:hypothetical protein